MGVSGGYSHDAVVIGGGPAGTVAAALLARAGWRVALAEKQPFPRRKVCGECIAPSALMLLEQLGMGHALRAHAGPALKTLAVWRWDERIVAALPPADGRHRWGRAIGREALDVLLLGAAADAGVEVFQPWAVKRVAGAAADFRFELADGEGGRTAELRAPVMIDAHGSWQRSPAGDDDAAASRHPSDLFAFKANFSDTTIEPGVLSVIAFDGGYGGMVLKAEEKAVFAFCIRRDRLAACRQTMPQLKAAEAAAAYVSAQCGGVRDALTGASLSASWLATGPLRPGVRVDACGEAFPVGNAAGEAHPVIGEGLNMAIRSAWLLAGMIGPHRARCADVGLQRSLRSAYAQAWRRHFLKRLRLASAFAHAAMRSLPSRMMLPLLTRRPALLTRAAVWSGKAECVPGQMQADEALHDIKAAGRHSG